eukprot:978327-Prymnesium_polylepis.1
MLRTCSHTAMGAGGITLPLGLNIVRRPPGPARIAPGEKLSSRGWCASPSDNGRTMHARSREAHGHAHGDVHGHGARARGATTNTKKKK